MTRRVPSNREKYSASHLVDLLSKGSRRVPDRPHLPHAQVAADVMQVAQGRTVWVCELSTRFGSPGSPSSVAANR